MKNHTIHAYTKAGFWFASLIAGLFLSSCATRPGTRQSHVPPADNRPILGNQQTSVTREKLRPVILVTLIKRAEQQIRSKDLNAAFATLERAIGIDAQDSFVWHLMARIKLSQGNLQQAENLAKKSNLLAVYDPSLQKKNWDIIAKSLDLQGKISEAEAARRKARE